MCRVNGLLAFARNNSARKIISGEVCFFQCGMLLQDTYIPGGRLFAMRPCLEDAQRDFHKRSRFHCAKEFNRFAQFPK